VLELDASVVCLLLVEQLALLQLYTSTIQITPQHLGEVQLLDDISVLVLKVYCIESTGIDNTDYQVYVSAIC
jgi:hypothetical protein